MRVLDAAIDLMLPRSCPVCSGDSGHHGGGVCGRCLALLQADFRAVPPPRHIDESWALGVYRAPMGRLVRRAKYGRDLALADAMGVWMGAAAQRLPAVDVVVPISAHWWRVLLRGQDVPPRLALGVSRAIGVPLCTALRQRRHRTQVGQGRAARLENAQDRFFMQCAISRRVLLVDDVHTTGATLSAAAAVLRANGAERIASLTAVVRPWNGVKKSFQ